MARRRSIEAAQRHITRYNRERERIEKARYELELREQRLNQTYKAAFETLPEGYMIRLGHDEPFALIDPDGNEVPS